MFKCMGSGTVTQLTQRLQEAVQVWLGPKWGVGAGWAARRWGRGGALGLEGAMHCWGTDHRTPMRLSHWRTHQVDALVACRGTQPTPGWSVSTDVRPRAQHEEGARGK